MTAGGQRANVVNAVNRVGLAAEEATKAGQEEFLDAHGRDFQSEFTGRQRNGVGRRRPSANPRSRFPTDDPDEFNWLSGPSPKQSSCLPAKDFALGGVCLYEEPIKHNQTMKTRLLLPVLLVALSLASAFGQPQPNPPPAPMLARLPGQRQPEAPNLTKFSLDFPGGTPKQLVAAIEKATKRPLNAIIPDETADEPIPPLKMSEITVVDLFKAIEMASIKNVAYPTGSYYAGGGGGKPSFSYQQMRTSIGFQTDMPPTDNSIWYFHGREKVPDIAKWSAEPPAPRTCRFYPLTSYLERGLTVDDITTAIQTGWKMLGDQETPTISFHKETKLLIAVGEQAKLETIDAVLKALSRTPEETLLDQSKMVIQKSKVGGSPSPPAKPAEKPKTEN